MPLPGAASGEESVPLLTAPEVVDSGVDFEEASTPRSLAWLAAAEDCELPGAGGAVGAAGRAGVGVGFGAGAGSGWAAAVGAG